MPRTAPRRSLAVLVAAVLVAAGCSGNGDPQASPSPDPATSAPSEDPSPSAAPVLPLTGQAAPNGLPDRPVLVVKVDNTAGARPQVGLSGADLVVEELVEGGLTRLAVMFHSTLPDVVGPVRSVRTSDIGIVAPTGGVLAASGGAGVVLDAIAAAEIAVIAEGDAGFSRDGSRRAPYNVMLDPAAALAGRSDPPPDQPYLPWAAPDVATDPTPAGTAATTATVVFSRTHSTRWEWSGQGWQRADELAADTFTPDSVLVLHVTTRDAGYTDPAGNPVPETVLEGSGAAILLTAGHAVEATWARDGGDSPLTLTDADGTPLLVPPGRVWIELVPEAGSVTVE